VRRFASYVIVLLENAIQVNSGMIRSPVLLREIKRHAAARHKPFYDAIKNNFTNHQA